MKSDQLDDRPLLDSAGIVIRRPKVRAEQAKDLPHTPAAQRRTQTPSRDGGVDSRDASDEADKVAESAAAKEAKKARKRAERHLRRAKDAKLRQCPECLREKPAKAFPDGRGKTCLDCGGRVRGTSVPTVRGGLPGLGRR